MTDETRPDQDEAPAAPERTLAWGFALLVLAIVVAGLAHRTIDHLVRGLHWNEFQSRQYEMGEGLPSVFAERQPLGLIVGGSAIMRLNPLTLDAALDAGGLHVVTYNLSLPLFHPKALAVLADRLDEELGRRTRRAALTVVDLDLLVLTKKGYARADLGRFSHIELHDTHTLRHWLTVRPMDALDVAFRKYALGGADVDDISDWFSARVLHRSWPCRRDPFSYMTSAERDGMAATCLMLDRESPGGLWHSWDLTYRGFQQKVTPNTRATYESSYMPGTQRPAFLRSNLQRVAETYDMLDLDFDDAAVEEYLTALRQLQTFSDRVVLVLFPEHPLVQRSPAAQKRLAALLTRIEKTFPDVIDLHGDPRFTAADFMDSMHPEFHPRASDKFALAIAEGILTLEAKRRR